MPSGGERDEEDRDDVLDVGEAATDLVGALAGGAVGSIGGPPGIVLGAAVGVAAQRGARVALDRLRGRERTRAEAAVLIIAADAEGRRERDESPRNDGFFDPRGQLRPDAEELLEGVLRHAAETWEEEKLPYLAHLYDSVAHDPSIGPETARFLLRLAGDLTYRQLLCLAAQQDRDRYNHFMLKGLDEKFGTRRSPDVGVTAEEEALVARGLLGVRNPKSGEVIDPAITWQGEEPAPRVITPLGNTLASVLRLDLVPDAELERWAKFDLLHR
jgi:hypothetical protein